MCSCKDQGSCCNDIALYDDNCLMCWGLDGNCFKCSGEKTLIDNVCTKNPDCLSVKDAKCIKCKPNKTVRANGACETDINCNKKAKVTRICDDGFNNECHQGGCLECKDGFTMDKNWECKEITNAPTNGPQIKPTRNPFTWPTMYVKPWPTYNPVQQPTRKPLLKGL